MKTHLLLIILLVGLIPVCYPQVSINTNGSLPDSHAMLDVSSNSKGVLVPRMTQAERDAIVSPPNGLLIYNTSSVSFQYFNGVSWINVTHSGIVTGTVNKVARFVGPFGLQNGLMTDNLSGVSLNTTNAIAHPSAIWDVSSNNKGLLIPRMTSTERIAIASPAKGLMVFDSTLNSFMYHDGLNWTSFSSNGGSWQTNGSHIYTTNTGNVGINTINPVYKLDVNGSIRGTDGNLTSLVVSGDVVVTGNLALLGNAEMSGKGLVIGSTSATQRIYRATGSFSLNGLAPNGFAISGTLNFPAFSDIPTVTMGAVSNGNGNWYQVSVVPASVTNSSCVFIFSNNSTVPVTFANVVWQIIIVGNQ